MKKERPQFALRPKRQRIRNNDNDKHNRTDASVNAEEEWSAIDTASADFITVLKSAEGKRLTKRISISDDGKPVIEDYEGGTLFTSREVPIASLGDLARVMVSLGQHSCLIHGKRCSHLNGEAHPRRKIDHGDGWGITYVEAAHKLLIIDLDGLKARSPGWVSL